MKAAGGRAEEAAAHSGLKATEFEATPLGRVALDPCRGARAANLERGGTPTRRDGLILHARLLRGQKAEPLLQGDAVLRESYTPRQQHATASASAKDAAEVGEGGGGGWYLGELVIGGKARGVGRGCGSLADRALLERVNALACLVKMVEKMHCYTTWAQVVRFGFETQGACAAASRTG
jgi:hypothetical protein